MAWCRQATSHYLRQCWPRSMSPNGVIRPQLIKADCCIYFVCLLSHYCVQKWLVACFVPSHYYKPMLDYATVFIQKTTCQQNGGQQNGGHFHISLNVLTSYKWLQINSEPSSFCHSPEHHFRGAYIFLNLYTFQYSPYNKIHIFECMGKILCVEFQREPLKFLSKYLTHTFKYKVSVRHWHFNSSLI